MAFEALRRNYERNAAEDAVIAQIARQALADVTAEDFENLVADVYVRHLSQQHLSDLADFTETSTGNRFFRTAFGYVREGKEIPRDEFMRQFSAEELVFILRAAESEAFVALGDALPRINEELAIAGQRFGERKLREFLNK